MNIELSHRVPVIHEGVVLILARPPLICASIPLIHAAIIVVAVCRTARTEMLITLLSTATVIVIMLLL